MMAAASTALQQQKAAGPPANHHDGAAAAAAQAASGPVPRDPALDAIAVEFVRTETSSNQEERESRQLRRHVLASGSAGSHPWSPPTLAVCDGGLLRAGGGEGRSWSSFKFEWRWTL